MEEFNENSEICIKCEKKHNESEYDKRNFKKILRSIKKSLSRYNSLSN